MRSASLTNRVLDPGTVVTSIIFLVISTPSLCQITFGTGRPVTVTLSLRVSPALTLKPSKYSGPNSIFGEADLKKSLQHFNEQRHSH